MPDERELRHCLNTRNADRHQVIKVNQRKAASARFEVQKPGILSVSKWVVIN